MALFTTLLSLFILAGVLFFCAQGVWEYRRLKYLSDVPLRGKLPSLSIIVAARQEERKIAAGVRSLLGVDYPDVRVVAVDDRSTDRTGEILDDLAKTDRRLSVVHLTDLPADWLGKNHALQRGARGLDSEYLLFTDADVVLAPSAVARAVSYAEEYSLDHLTVFPQMETPGIFLPYALGTIRVFLLTSKKAGRVRFLDNQESIGIGAFNLVRTSVYRAIGGHEKIRMRPDDDLMLARLIKLSGYRPDVLLGEDQVRVEWYPSVWEMVRGLEKNSMATQDYSVPKILFTLLQQLLFTILPYAGVFSRDPIVRGLSAASVATLAVCYYILQGKRRGPRDVVGALLFWASSLVLAFTTIRATALTFFRGGIFWRETFYPIDALKKNRL